MRNNKQKTLMDYTRLLVYRLAEIGIERTPRQVIMYQKTISDNILIDKQAGESVTSTIHQLTINCVNDPLCFNMFLRDLESIDKIGHAAKPK